MGLNLMEPYDPVETQAFLIEEERHIRKAFNKWVISLQPHDLTSMFEKADSTHLSLLDWWRLTPQAEAVLRDNHPMRGCEGGWNCMNGCSCELPNQKKAGARHGKR